MKTAQRIFATLIFTLILSAAYSQNFYPASGKYERPGKAYKEHTRNRSIQVRPTDSYQAPIKLRANRTYFFSVIGKQSANVQFKIIDAETQIVLYDNAAYGFGAAVECRTNRETEIIIEIATVYNTKSKENVNFLYAYK
jgi:hypothetical protein